MSERQIFSGPMLIVLIAGTTAIFALSMLLALTTPSTQPTSGSDTRSASALGHAGLYELLQRTGVPVARSQVSGIVTASGDDLLVMAEPPPGGLSQEAIIRLGRARNVLLVLPKRTGVADEDNPAWVSSTTPIRIDDAASIARLVDPKIEVVRTDPPRNWTTNSLGIVPAFDDNVQLIESDNLIPVIANGKDVLIALYGEGEDRVWIVSDPDLIENHSLALGQNADLAVALLNRLRGNAGTVVFDETIHGMVNIAANPLRKLIEFPMVIVLLLTVVAGALLLWATMGRFGKPRPDPPAFDFGKRRLIATTSSLLDRAGYQSSVMRRYIEFTLRNVGQSMRAPHFSNDMDLAAWLDTVSEARGLPAKAAGIAERAQRAHATEGRSQLALFAAAQDIHQWKEEISDGTSGRRENR